MRLMNICFCLTASFSIFLACNKVASQKNTNNESLVNKSSIESKGDIRAWIQPRVFGLTVGKSTLKDVRRRFGKPTWIGANQEKVFTDDAEDEILVQYFDRKVPEVYGTFGRVNLDIVIGKKSKILKVLGIYSEKAISKEDVISMYGGEYFEINGWESDCIEKDRVVGPTSRKLIYPILLAYPNKGISVSINDANYMVYIEYRGRCVKE